MESTQATTPLRKFSKKLVAAAPQSGALHDAVGRFAVKLDQADAKLHDIDFAKASARLRALPWARIGLVATAAGVAAFVFKRRYGAAEVARPATPSRAKAKSGVKRVKGPSRAVNARVR